jgi:uncharacterized protein DUF559
MSSGPFRGSEAVARGVVTGFGLRRGRYRRVFPDVYVPSDYPDDLKARSRAAYELVRGRGGVLAGYSAALLLGADCAPERAPAEVLVPRDARAHTGLRVQRGPVTAADVTSAHGCRVTTAARTAWDLARRVRLVEAVVAVDALARTGGFVPEDLLARRTRSPGARGCRRLDEVVRLADPRAESPPETRLRLLLTWAGLPPAVQHEVLDEHGFLVARVDLAYPDAKLAIEYDGAGHVRQRDHARDTELADHGWDTVHLTKHDLADARFQTLVKIARLLARRAPRRYQAIEIDRSAVFRL